MPTTESLSLVVRRHLNAPPSTVFDAWTSPETLKRWCSPGGYTNPVAEADLRVGGKYRIDMVAPDGRVSRATGVYREVDRPRRLAFTWFWETNPERGEMLVALDFVPTAGGTELVLTHSQLVSEESRTNHGKGWAGCLDKLEALLG
jgi:uncharacterized protein YndB with AHSA1/START domain